MGADAGSARLVGLLRNRAFLLLQARGTAAAVGYTVYLATVLWLSYRLSGGIFLAGVVVAVELVVYTLTFLAAPLVDRVVDKRSVYLLCYPVQAVAAFALGVTYFWHLLTVPLLLALVALLAVLWDFTWAADAVSPRLLFGADQLFAVSGMGSAIGGAVDIAIYLFAGLTIALFGVAGGSYLYAALLAAGAGFAVLLPIPTPRTGPRPYLASFRQGWELYRGPAGSTLRQLAVLQAAYGVFVSAPTLLLTLYVVRFFGAGQATYAALYVAYLVGGIVIGLILGAANPRRHLGPVATLTIALTGAALVAALAAAGSLVLSLAAWTAVGVLMTARTTTFSIYLQGAFPPDVLARVAGNNYLFPGITSAIGAIAVGALSTVWSPATLTELVAAVFGASAVLGWALPGTRRLAY